MKVTPVLDFDKPETIPALLAEAAPDAVVNCAAWTAVDIREGSPTYGEHVAIELSAANWLQLWVPRGFAHGYLTLEPDTEVLYKTDAYYARESDAAIRWDDPALGIAWPQVAPILSEKDRAAPLLSEIPPPFPRGSW